MKRTFISIVWSEIDFEIKYIRAIGVTFVMTMYLLYNGSTS